MNDKDIMYQTALDVASRYPVPIKNLPLSDQVDEIERRLQDIYKLRVSQGLPLTIADMAVVLGVVSDTVTAWSRGTDVAGNELRGNGSDEDKQILERRKDLLKKWLEVGASWCFQVAMTAKNYSTALFDLKAVYKYREYEDPKQIEITYKFEDLQRELEQAERERTDTRPSPE